MKKLLCFLLAATLVLTFSGCQEEKGEYIPTGDALVGEDEIIIPDETQAEAVQEIVLVYNPKKSMNPILSTDFTNRVIFSLLYQGMFCVDKDYNVEPVLCGSYRYSDDMTVYTFYVDPKATFSDGTPVTINDVFASYTAAKESDYFGGRFRHVLDMFISADGGVTFWLDTAHENFPLQLDMPILKESEVAADNPLGTGPYYLSEGLSGMYLRRRQDWWCSAPDMVIYTSSIFLRPNESPADIRDAFQFEDVSLVCGDPSSEKFAEFRSDYELFNCDNGMYLYLGCNTGGEIFSNEKVRAALTYAIDREYIVNTFYSGYALAATLPASPMSPFYSDNLAQRYAYDPGVFEEVLAKEGMLGKPLILLVNKDDTLRMRVARAIGQILTDCGFKVEMAEKNRESYLYALGTRKYDLYLGQTKLSPNMDLSSFFREGGTFRYGGMTDKALYRLCRDALANQGNYYNLHQTIADDGRLTSVLFHSYAVFTTRGLMTELTPARDNIFYYSIGKTMHDAVMFNE